MRKWYSVLLVSTLTILTSSQIIQSAENSAQKQVNSTTESDELFLDDIDTVPAKPTPVQEQPKSTQPIKIDSVKAIVKTDTITKAAVKPDTTISKAVTKSDTTTKTVAKPDTTTKAKETGQSELKVQVVDTSKKVVTLPDTSTKAKAQVKESVLSEDLILEGGEEDLLEQAKPKQKPVAETKPVTEVKSVTSTPGAVADTTKQAAISEIVSDSVKTVEVKKEIAVVKEAPALKVEKEKSINFAQSLKEYRKPKLAFLLSLCVPGLGQIYCKRYAKAAAFIAAEVGIVGTSVAIRSRGDEQKKKAYAFADNHWNIDTAMNYYRKISSHATSNPNDTAKRDAMNDFLESVDTTALKEGAGKKDKDFYNIIYNVGNMGNTIQGWDDCEPRADMITGKKEGDIITGKHKNYIILDDTTFWKLGVVGGKGKDSLSFGYSENFKTYRDLYRKYNDTYELSSGILYLLILNHVISALNAAIEAKNYNNELLNQQSVWDNVSFKHQYVYTGSETVPGIALQVKF